MMVSTRGRYALRLMIDIAKQGEAGALVTMRQAAQRQGLSVKYLEQLGGALVRAGVLKSIRGVSGGYYLAKPADQIRIGDVLRATEGSCMPVACVDDEGKCDLAGSCEARGFWRGWAMPSTPISTASRLPMCWKATWRHSRFQGVRSIIGNRCRQTRRAAACKLQPVVFVRPCPLAMRAREAMVGLSRTHLAT